MLTEEQQRQKIEWDNHSILKTSWMEGFKEGFQEGFEEASGGCKKIPIRVAKKMKEKGYSLELIVECTELKMEEVKEL